MLCVHQWQRTLTCLPHPLIPGLDSHAEAASLLGNFQIRTPVRFQNTCGSCVQGNVAGTAKRTSSHDDLGVCWKLQRKQEVLTPKHKFFFVYAWTRPVHFSYLASIDPCCGELGSHTKLLTHIAAAQTNRSSTCSKQSSTFSQSLLLIHQAETLIKGECHWNKNTSNEKETRNQCNEFVE